ncbi:Npt1p [Malassezia vespertilionis]|uniref:nicotinate phosphoribosyltransferase n=1 Tax=Malassezia vespertilionis TaxID=2020962 RepID=A0A2N1JH64_9BASI|nr:Npt1p [Malassezia vespertilionis]
MLFTRACVDAIRTGIEPSQVTVEFVLAQDTDSPTSLSAAKHPSGDELGYLSLEIKGTWKDIILYEVPVMAIISESYFAYVCTDWTLQGQCEMAMEKARTLLRNGVAFSEFGTRRRRSLQTHVDVLEGLVHAAAQVQRQPGTGRLLGTSNMYLAKRFELVPVGTIAHEWTMAIAALNGYEHSNLRALQLWDALYQPPAFTPENLSQDLSIALTDTFSTRVFWDDLLSDPAGVEMLRRWRGVRQDSGDSEAFVRHAVDVYRKAGVDPSTKLVVFSDGLDVARCLFLQRYAAEMGIMAGFGIGTNMTNDFTCASRPEEKSSALNIVIKLDSIQGRHAVKISDELTKNTGDPTQVAYVKRRFGLDAVEDA